MYERDYILRLITQVGQMLQSMLQAVREHRPEDSLKVARDAVAALLETGPELADALTGEGLAAFLSAGGRSDVLRSRMLGEVLIVRAEAHIAAGEPSRARYERDRARTVLEAALPGAEGEEGERIEALLAVLAE